MANSSTQSGASGREYPRSWWKATRWDDEPVERVFIRETDQKLVDHYHGKDQFTSKHTDYARWFPTREAAEAAIAAHKAHEKSRADDKRIRDAALGLLAAGEALVFEAKQGKGVSAASLNDMLAAIAKARGQ